MSGAGCIGVGVGPGDPGLLTLNAIARAATRPTSSPISPRRGTRAMRGPSPPAICKAGVEELPLLYPVTTEIPKHDAAYREAIARLLRRRGRRDRRASRRRAASSP